MENINELLGSVLSNPDSMAKLRETARMLGLEPSGENTESAGRAENPPDAAEPLSGLAPALQKLTPILGKLNEEDDMTKLMHALMPFLSGARLKRAEEASRMVSVMRVIPLLRTVREE